ncbi:MAG: hypothetical protein ACE5GL_03535 [Calditrichia bacterium]
MVEVIVSHKEVNSVLVYVYFVIAINMSIASFIMIQHRNRNIVRVLGLILAYVAAAVALKVYYMVSGA